MSIIGNSWKDDPSLDEQYESITGNKLDSSDEYKAQKQIADDIYSPHTSRFERSKLLDLFNSVWPSK